MKLNYQQKDRIEFFWVLGLFLAAVILYTINLGSLPLRDWDEGTFAQVAKEIYQSPPHQLRWLFPTLWGEPYLNKPSLIHSLTALVYRISGVNEFSSRIVGAVLTASSVPLLYCVGREIFVPRYYALFSALVYLTTFPVVRHGRLAMLDGAVLCFQLLMLWGILRSRRDLRWTLVAGMGFSLICLSKGWMLGLLASAITFFFLAWDTPRLLTSIYWWLGMLVGTIPVAIWQSLQWMKYGELFVNTAIKVQSLERIYNSVEGNQGFFGYYLIELLKYLHPWLFIAIFGIKAAWEHRNWSWGKLILIWSGVYLVAVSAMMTKLPWYILPIYPALALAAGVGLAQLKSLPGARPYPRSWFPFFTLLSLVSIGGVIYFAFWSREGYQLLLIFSCLALTMAITALLLKKRDEQFIVILFWGMYVALILFFCSDYWLWELNEAYPVKPVAAIVKNYVPKNEIVYTSFAYTRPSLNFYSEHQVIALSPDQLENLWKEKGSLYLLIDRVTLDDLKVKIEPFNRLHCSSDLERAAIEVGGYQIYCISSTDAADWKLIYRQQQ